ncbi:MAG: CHAT domain-containing protein [Scytonema sp. PMC 1069.18]|nr:CHAT domain-containing protein [Scytonema sp. PMC 1069.18]MEC4880823.1 CHAT domain-containing protein [Scytonema sp. PMC 1070.18]
MSETSATNLDIAMERVVGFAQKFDRAHLDLACHAAFPQTLTPDLLYQIWLRFVPQAPWTAVARILLSRLCREVGYELYEMDVAVRNLLLTELKEDKRFDKQLDKLAEFYSHYLRQQFGSEEGEEKDLTQPQHWIVLAHSQPNQVNRELAKALESRFKQENWKELFRIASSIEAIPEALAEFEAPLMTYARGMLSYTTGDLEGAAEEFSKLQRRELQVEIAGVNLSIPDEVEAPLIEVELAFLQRLLQIISESNSDAQVVYSFLQKNIEKLNEHLVEVLRLWAKNNLTEAQPDEAQSRATVISNFSILLTQFPLGSRARNIEIAITGYEIVLTVFTREVFPKNWAGIQALLGNAYRDRIQGNKAENLEQALTYFLAALQIFNRDDFPQDWALTQISLGEAYINRIQGNKAENLEQAIASCLAALQILTRDDFPQDWAGTQINLGIAYINRIWGEKAENLECAIAAFAAALEVRTRSAFPYEWAATQNALGTAYISRIKGEKAKNLEYAIATFLSVLEIFTRTSFPQQWALTQNNLGTAYRDRILGERAENLERAIAAFSAALQVYTRSAFPQNWAETQNNLGTAYRDRIIGDRAENLERAIATYSAALQVYTRESFPYHWALTQNNLGTAYRNRIRGDRAENLETAIAAYQAASSVRTREALPLDWAATQNNLGLAYRDRIKGDRTDNIENAIAAFAAALQVRTLEALPYDWAETQNNLATAYCNRILGERAENIELAIACFQDALRVRTIDAFPIDWAETQNNLATAYLNRIRGNKAENLEIAIACLQETLRVYTFDAFPQNYAETLFNMGIAYQKAKQFTSAYNAFKSAATVESLRSEIIFGEETKRKQAQEWNKLYSCMVEVCLELSNIAEAIEYVERSKTRNLVELILERDSETIFPPDVVTQLETYRDEIATGQYQIQNGKAENPKVLAQHLQELRQQHNELQNHYLRVCSGFKFDSFQASLDERIAIIEWFILNDKILAFIVTKRGEVVWQSQPEDREALENWLNQYLQNYDQQKDQWWKSLGEELKKLASILHIEEILTQIPKHCNRLILIPHRFLHLLPLHALPVGESYLIDLFPNGLGYVPSCQLLQLVQTRQRSEFSNLFAIQNPTGDLSYSKIEVESIEQYFTNKNVLVGKTANKTEVIKQLLKSAHCVHFSSHGYFNLNSPLESALILADANISGTIDLSECLTLAEIFNLNLSQCRLVTLSADETALTDFTSVSDEYIGFPSAFIVAGTTSVVGSLWSVNDLSTALLMIKFYQNLYTGSTVAVALSQAQIWLRDITVSELTKWIEENQLLLDATSRMNLRRKFSRSETEEHPFGNPLYWAAFCYIGQMESKMSPYEENILTFVYILQNQPELLTAEDRTDVLKLLATLPDDVEEISNAIALWYETRPHILDAILNVPVEDLDSLRAAGGRRTPITGAESKEMIENSVTQSSKSNQPDSSSSQTKKE